jgi:hypothetical protein
MNGNFIWYSTHAPISWRKYVAWVEQCVLVPPLLKLFHTPNAGARVPRVPLCTAFISQYVISNDRERSCTLTQVAVLCIAYKISPNVEMTWGKW